MKEGVGDRKPHRRSTRFRKCVKRGPRQMVRRQDKGTSCPEGSMRKEGSRGEVSKNKRRRKRRYRLSDRFKHLKKIILRNALEKARD